MAKLTTIEGIGEAYAAKLKSAGIRSTTALLSKGATKAGRERIAMASGIAYARILRFVNHADLMRVRGVGGEYAELLEAAGIDSVPELRHRNAQSLTIKLRDVNAGRGLVRVLPGERQVTNWVAEAQTLQPVVRH